MVATTEDQARLRSNSVLSPFHVLLVEPEIPPNTGNIARLCAATCSPLHLIGKLGFSIDEHAVRRAGLDYWHLVELQTHASLDAAETRLRANGNRNTWLFSGRGHRSYADVAYSPGDLLVFGKESRGLDPDLLRQRPDQVVGIPTLGGVRSLNLSNSVAIALYEALRQVGALKNAELL